MTRLVSLFFPCYLTKLAIFSCNLLMKFTFFSGINWWNSRFLHIRLMRFAVLIHEWLTKSMVLFRNHLTKLMIFCNNQFTKIADFFSTHDRLTHLFFCYWLTKFEVFFATDWWNLHFFLQLSDKNCSFICWASDKTYRIFPRWFLWSLWSDRGNSRFLFMNDWQIDFAEIW